MSSSGTPPGRFGGAIRSAASSAPRSARSPSARCRPDSGSTRPTTRPPLLLGDARLARLLQAGALAGAARLVEDGRRRALVAGGAAIGGDALAEIGGGERVVRQRVPQAQRLGRRQLRAQLGDAILQIQLLRRPRAVEEGRVLDERVLGVVEVRRVVGEHRVQLDGVVARGDRRRRTAAAARASAPSRRSCAAPGRGGSARAPPSDRLSGAATGSRISLAFFG